MAAAEGGAGSPWQQERLLFVWELPPATPDLVLLGRPAHAAVGALPGTAPPTGNPCPARALARPEPLLPAQARELARAEGSSPVCRLAAIRSAEAAALQASGGQESRS